MTIKEIKEQLSEFPDDQEFLVWQYDMGLIKTDFVAENINDEEYNGAAVLYVICEMLK